MRAILSHGIGWAAILALLPVSMAAAFWFRQPEPAFAAGLAYGILLILLQPIMRTLFGGWPKRRWIDRKDRGAQLAISGCLFMLGWLSLAAGPSYLHYAAYHSGRHAFNEFFATGVIVVILLAPCAVLVRPLRSLN